MMNEFLMIFRTEKNENASKPSMEEMQVAIQQWQDWIGGIAAQGKFIGTNALDSEGRTVSSQGVISDGPYAELKEVVGGYILVKAENLEDAVRLSEGCPTLAVGGKVEIRKVMDFSAYE